MVKTKISFLVLGLATLSCIAQKPSSDRINTNFFQFPNYDVTKVKAEDIHVEYSSLPVKLGEEKRASTESMCVPKNGGLNDVKEMTVYYYEIPVLQNEAFIVAKIPNNEIVFAEKYTADMQKVEFGKKKCKYWIDIFLKQDFKAKKDSFLTASIKNIEKATLDNAIGNATSQLLPSFINESFKIYSAKDKSFSYEELEHAKELAIEAYEAFQNKKYSEQPFNQLNEAISIWEKELTNLDASNKKARINKNIAKGIYENLGHAYLYTYQISKAIEAFEKSIQLWGGFSNNRRIDVEAYLKLVKNRNKNLSKNTKSISNINSVVKLANDANKKSLNYENLNSNEYERLKTEYQSFLKQSKGDDFVNEIELFKDKNKDNPYRGLVVESTTQGKTLALNKMQLMVLGIEFENFPIEVCDIIGLNTLNLRALNITEIPAEISNLKQIKTLNLSKNNISSIPKEIGDLENLKVLNLSKNPIEDFPEEIKNCKNLKKLILKGNKLSPEQKKTLKKLLPNTKIKF